MSRKSKNRDIRTLPLAEWENVIRKWCRLNGAVLKITKASQHWRIGAGLRLFADWWPATGKLHVNGKHHIAMQATGVLPWLAAGLLEATLSPPTSPVETALADAAHLTPEFIGAACGDIPAEKPPLGVMPRWRWLELRAAELTRAISASIAIDRYMPEVAKWCDELAALLRELDRKESDEQH